MKKKADAEKAIRAIAEKNGVSVGEVREQITLAILAGLRSEDPAVRARWEKVPREGETPTPEELIAYLAARVGAGVDPFA